MRCPKVFLLFLVALCVTWIAGQDAGDPKEKKEAAKDLDDKGKVDGDEEEPKTEDIIDPCLTLECEKGKECENREGKGVCVCQKSCPSSYSRRLQVCSSQNHTLPSVCELDRQICMCKNNEKGCQRNRGSAKLKHYGACQVIKPCTAEEKEEFPLRIRRWVMVTMFDLAGRSQLGASGFELAREAIASEEPWVNPTLWKFCDLDVDGDGSIKGDELDPLTAHLMVIESCVVDFLKDCGGSSGISLSSWGECMGLEKEKVKNRCAGVQREREAARQKATAKPTPSEA